LENLLKKELDLQYTAPSGPDTIGPMGRGRFWTLEGPEGAGKTTQLARLQVRLEEAGYPVVRTREPGGDAVGERVRELLLSTEMTAEAELLLFAAARAQNVAQIVRPALQSGALVLCDRFTDSSLAYQGFARGLSLDAIRAINVFATGALIPEKTFLLDLPAAEGLARRRTGETNRLDDESLAFHERVRAGFLSLAAAEPERFVVVDATRSEDGVAGALWAVIELLL
jgi:dTMP kinase